jgi:hypothetical protein
VIDIKNSQEVNRLMQPFDFEIKSITSLYYIVRGQSTDASLTSNINRDGTHKQTGGRPADVALFAEELIENLQYSCSKGFGVMPKSCIH